MQCRKFYVLLLAIIPLPFLFCKFMKNILPIRVLKACTVAFLVLGAGVAFFENENLDITTANLFPNSFRFDYSFSSFPALLMIFGFHKSFFQIFR